MYDLREKITEILPRVKKPARYLGCEYGSVSKDWDKASLRFAFAFPDVYEIGMSHLGHQILYHIINDRPDMLAERVYAPWHDMAEELRKNNLPLFSLESYRPLAEFDAVGFSLSYELCCTNMLLMLDLAGIPFRSKDRNEKHPLIIAGGPCAFNPEPVADFFDAIVIGDGEEVILKIADLILKFRNNRQKLLRELSKLDGVYVPSFFEIDYDTNGAVKNIKPRFEDYKGVKKAIAADLDNTSLSTNPIVPYVQVTHDRVGIEVQRGCARGCRFCQAGYVYRPVRQRSPEKVLALSKESLDNSGHENLAFLSLSIGDYKPLCGVLLETINADTHVNISMPSMRVETLTEELLSRLEDSRKSSFTLAPEAGTEELRKSINKGNSDDDLYKTVEEVFKKGWSRIKLYFMTGLPGETNKDLEGIVQMAGKVLSIGRNLKARPNIAISTSTFVPKSFTPFQWEAQLSLEQMQERQDYLKKNLRGRGLEYRWHNPGMSLIEGVMSRGDRRLSSVIEDVYKNKGGFDAWDEHFVLQAWLDALGKFDLDINSYQRKKNVDERLAWDHLNVGLDKKFLLSEYNKAVAGDASEDCTKGKCLNCGVCDFKEVKNKIYDVLPEAASREVASVKEQFKYYLAFEKLGSIRFLSHLETMGLIVRAIRRAHLPLMYSEGFHPHPKLSMYGALPVGMESEEEFFDITLHSNIDCEEIKNKINPCLPKGFAIRQVSPAALQVSKKYDYLLCADVDAGSFKKSEAWPVELTRKNGAKNIDLKAVIEDLAEVERGVIRLSYKAGCEDAAKPYEILGGLLKISLDEARNYRIRKVK